MVKGERVIVAVEKGSSSKYALKWALGHKIKAEKDTLCLLHIVSKVTTSAGIEKWHSDLDATSYMDHLENSVFPMMLAYKKTIDPSVSVALKVEKCNSIAQGIIDQARKFKATCIVVGCVSKSMFGSRSSSGSIGSYCVKHNPPGISVYVIQKNKVIKQAHPHSVTPLHSGTATPMGSTRFTEEMLSSINETLASCDDNIARLPSDSEKPISPSLSSSNSGSNGSGDITEEDSFPVIYHSHNQNHNQNHNQEEILPRFGCIPLSPYRNNSTPNNNHYNHIDSNHNVISTRTFKLTPNRLRVGRESKYRNNGQDYTYRDKYDAEYENGNSSTTKYEYFGVTSSNPSRMGTPSRGDFHVSESPYRPRGNCSPLSNGKVAGWGLIRRKEDYSQSPSRPLEVKIYKKYVEMKKKADDAENARSEAEKRAKEGLEEAERLLKEVEEQSNRRELESMARIEQARREAELAIIEAKKQQEIAKAEAEKREQALKEVELHRAMLEEEMRRRAEAEERAYKEEESINHLRHFRKYTWEELQDATDNFSPERKLGEGGYGSVFSGTLHHTPVAIKVLKNSDTLQAAHEFHQEVEVLGQIQHPHMVMLLGCCPERYCLVYEYMANGSLEERIACKKETPPLPWFVRIRIAAEVASALLILHSRDVPIVHRDLKPANILLDKNLVAKLGDVGLARLMPGLTPDRTYLRESTPVGTFRYVDPEFQRTGEFGTKSDVYAFGIVLLDMLTGIGNHSLEAVEEAVEACDENKLEKLLDPKAGTWPSGMAMEVASLAVRCAEMRRRQRPDLEAEVMPLLERFRTFANLEEDRQRLHRFPSTPDSFQLSSLFCPITQEMMVNPVMAADGHTYERAAIEHWLETDDRSPLTNLLLPHKELVPNHAVRSLIAEWQDRISCR